MPQNRLPASTTTTLAAGQTLLGLVHASVEGVEEESLKQALEVLDGRAVAMGADAIIGIQVAQTNFQWQPRTTLLGTAVKDGGSGAGEPLDK